MSSSQKHRWPRYLPVAGALIVAACAMPDRLVPGTPESQVRAQLGKPLAEYALPAAGAHRLEYGGQHEQLTWMVDIDAAGRVIQARQVRTAANFSSLRIGVDDQDTVRREFGTPYRVQFYKLSGLTAWIYPYREAGAIDMMMTVLFDGKGRVARLESGHDERWDVHDSMSGRREGNRRRDQGLDQGVQSPLNSSAARLSRYCMSTPLAPMIPTST